MFSTPVDEAFAALDAAVQGLGALDFGALAAGQQLQALERLETVRRKATAASSAAKASSIGVENMFGFYVGPRPRGDSRQHRPARLWTNRRLGINRSVPAPGSIGELCHGVSRRVTSEHGRSLHPASGAGLALNEAEYERGRAAAAAGEQALRE